VSEPIDARGVVMALGTDPNDYDRLIPLLDRLLTALGDGETIVFYGDAPSPVGGTMMCLADLGDWGTLIKTDFVMTQTTDTTTADAAPRISGWSAGRAATCSCGGKTSLLRSSKTPIGTTTRNRNMTRRTHAAPQLPRGRFIVAEDGEVVADGQPSDLVRADAEEAQHVDIYVHFDDVEGFRARWFECGESKRSLN
jgi:hypothetical protein